MQKNILISALLAASASLFAATAPNFTVTDSDGNAHQLYADYVNQGKVLVLEVFFTTCPPCSDHAPYWQNLYNAVKLQHPGRVEFMMLSNKSFDMNTNVAQYKTAKGLTMPGVGAQGGSLSAVQPYEAGQFGVFYGTPTFIVIAPGTGEVTFDLRGNNPTETMGLIQQRINQLLLPTCTIQTYLGDTLKTYSLQIAIPGGASANVQVTNGAYSLENVPGLPVAPFYLATPAKNNDPLNGVSTFDLLQINKQILGIELFNKPWQFIAADANNSGTISTFDIVELRKLILGIYDSLPNSPSWVFSPAQDTMSTSACPDIQALKRGDVNGNADPKSLLGVEDRTAGSRTFRIENRHFERGETSALPLHLVLPVAGEGFQFALLFNPEALEIRRIWSDNLPGFQDNNWFVSNGRIAFSWIANTPVPMVPGDVVLQIEVQALRDGSVADWFAPESAPLHPEAYDAIGRVYHLEWRVDNPAPQITLLAPNPASRFFTLHIDNPEEQGTQVQLVDPAGRTVYEQRVWLSSGVNTLRVEPGRLPAGLYLVRLGNRPAGKLHWVE